jgi:hypothetical protein
MALVVYDRVQETTATTGTGTLTLGGAVAGFQSFAVVGNGNTTYYTIVNGNQWEVGIGTYSTTGPTLARTTILSNSNGNTSPITLVDASSVFVTYPSEKSINYDADGVAVIGSPINYADTGLIATFASDVAGYNQVVIQNQSAATNASSNLNVSNNTSTSTSGFAELGINSSTFTGTGSFSIPNGSYLASAGTDLTIGTYNANDIHFVTNSNTTDAMVIHDGGGVALGGLSDPGIGNVAANKFVPGYTAVTSAAGTTVLTAGSNYYQNLLGSTTQTFQLPDATTLLVGTTFIFDNNSSGNLSVVDDASGPIETIPGGAAGFIYLTNNSTIAGSWNKHSFLPASYDFNSTTANFGTATITNATYQGNTIQPGYGGTGLTTFTAANNALYSTGASTLTAGTLPVAAGGTGATTDSGARTNLGLGTIATQNANAVAITGGSINGTTIGATTTSTGAFTSLAASGVTTVQAGTVSAPAITTTGDTNTGIFFPAADTIAFTEGGVESMRIDSSGNVGIGTSSPQVKLDVVNAGAVDLYVRATTDAAAQMFLHSNGANSSYSGIISYRADTAQQQWKIGGGPDQQTLRFTTGTTERMRIDSTGNVGIGTSSPTSLLHLNKASGAADIRFSVAGTLYGNIYASASDVNISSITAIPLIFNTNNLERMRLSSVGGLSLGTSTDPGGGAIAATGNITAFFSDQRLKNVSGKIENALDKVSSLSGVYYTMNDVAKSYGYDSEETHVGVLAQEVEAVLPEVVKAAPFDLDEKNNSKSGENYKTVQYEKLVPLLIEAIKELTEEVKELKAKVEM